MMNAVADTTKKVGTISSEIARIEFISEGLLSRSLKNETEVTSRNGSGEMTVRGLQSNFLSDFRIASNNSKDTITAPQETTEIQSELEKTSCDSMKDKLEVTSGAKNNVAIISRLQNSFLSNFGIAPNNVVHTNLSKIPDIESLQGEASREGLKDEAEVTSCNMSDVMIVSDTPDNSVADSRIPGGNTKGVGVIFSETLETETVQSSSKSLKDKTEVTSQYESVRTTVSAGKCNVLSDLRVALSNAKDIVSILPDAMEMERLQRLSNKSLEDTMEGTSTNERDRATVSCLQHSVVSRTTLHNIQNIDTDLLETVGVESLSESSSKNSKAKMGVTSHNESEAVTVSGMQKNVSDLGIILDNSTKVGIILSETIEIESVQSLSEDLNNTVEVTSCNDRSNGSVEDISEFDIILNNSENLGMILPETIERNWSRVESSSETVKDQTEVISFKEIYETRVSSMQVNVVSDFKIDSNTSGKAGTVLPANMEIELPQLESPGKSPKDKLVVFAGKTKRTMSGPQNTVAPVSETASKHSKMVYTTFPETVERPKDRTVTFCNESREINVSREQDNVVPDSGIIIREDAGASVPKMVDLKLLQGKPSEGPKDERQIISQNVDVEMVAFNNQRDAEVEYWTARNSSYEVYPFLSDSVKIESELGESPNRIVKDEGVAACLNSGLTVYDFLGFDESEIEQARLLISGGVRIKKEEEESRETSEFGEYSSSGIYENQSITQEEKQEDNRWSGKEYNFNDREICSDNHLLISSTSCSVNAQITEFDFLGFDESEIEQARLLTGCNSKVEEDFFGFDASEIEQARLIIRSLQIKKEDGEGIRVTEEVLEYSCGSGVHESQEVLREVKQEYCESIKEEHNLSDQEICFDHISLIPLYNEPIISKTDDNHWNESQMQSEISLNSGSVKLQRVCVELEDLFPSHLRKLGKAHSNTGLCRCIYCQGEYRYSGESQYLPQNCQDQTQPHSRDSQMRKMVNGEELRQKARRNKNALQCGNCPAKCKDEYALYLHRKEVHKGGNLYRCKFCLKQFALLSSLRVHYKVHNYDKPFKCAHCPWKFWKKSLLVSHMRKHTKERPFRCKQCSAAFMQQSVLTLHQRTHNIEKPFQCAQCPANFKFKSTLRVHLRVHSGEKPFNCTHCARKFTTSTQLRVHSRLHTGTKPFKCKLCPAKFTQAGGLKAHSRVHSGEKPYECKLCPRKFSQAWGLKLHSRLHSGEKPYECKLCPRKFSQAGALKTHSRVHSGEKPYECKLCPRKFSQAWGLKLHSRLHSGEKPYECKLCPRKFSHAGALKTHSRVHSGEKPYECKLCPRKFLQAGGLKSHSRVHSDEKLYKCKLCPLKFKQSGGRSTHVRNVHSDIRPFECKLCPAKFKWQKLLNDHMKRHTSEDPLSCAFCSVKYKRKTNLMYHLNHCH